MNNVKIKVNRSGVRELLQSDEIRQVCREQAEAIRQQCGDGYECDDFIGRNRANASVWPATAKARRDNARNNTMLKAAP